MELDDRITRLEVNLGRLAAVQEQMMDLLGMSIAGEQRLAALTDRHESTIREIDDRLNRLTATVQEIGDKLNGLIGVVDGFIRGKQ